ncbi:hypothetical protein J3R82DRAFT_4564 [Butyriboletus roseoflavus]|nr:hypothetical protein J3R82DRAFT_4564 [Butyriboletus roseoflavus]
MHTKGVSSVRSPVRNLAQSSASATHEAFVRAVIKSFREEYAIDEDPCFVHETSHYLEDEYFKVGMSELQASLPMPCVSCSLMGSVQGWDWAYGQTPEFEYVIGKTFQWGQLTSTIHSRHGIILSCSFSIPRDARIPLSTRAGLDRLSQRLIGKRYAFVDDSEVLGDDDGGKTEGMADIWSWLKREMHV